MAGRRRATAQQEPQQGVHTVNVQVPGTEPEPQVIVPPLPVVNVKVDGPTEEPADEGNTEQE